MKKKQNFLSQGGALLLYAGLAFVFFGPPGPFGDTLPGEGQDPLTFAWYLAWWPWALTHGLDPLISAFVWAPDGYNLAWGTSMPTAALLAAPVTLTKGPVFALSALMVAAPCLSAFFCFLLIRQLTGRSAAALVGGALFGFSSYETGQMLGHLNLVLNFPVPLILLLVARRGCGITAAPRFIAALVIALLLEFGLSTELFASLVALGAVSWCVFLVAGPAGQRALVRRLGRDMAIALAICAVVLLPYLLTMAAGASAFTGFVNPPEVYSSDALNLVVPTGVTRFGRSVFAGIAARFTGNASEQGGYLGLPLVLIVARFAWQRRADRWTRALLLTLFVLFVASLGPVLHVAGWNTHVPLPWALATHLPLIKGALPGRFSLYVALAAAIAAGLWIADARTRRATAVRLASGVLAALFLIPNRQAVAWSTPPPLAFFEPARIAQELRPSETILLLPYGVTGPGMFWQAQSGFAFRQAGGYLSFVPRRFERLAAVLDFFRGSTDENFPSDLAAFCAEHAVTTIVAGPGTPAALMAGLRGLGWPARETGGVTLFRVPLPDSLRYVTLRGESWPSGEGTWQLIGRQVTVATHRVGARVQLANSVLPGNGELPVEVVRGAMRGRLVLAARGTATLLVPPDTEMTLIPQRRFTQAGESRAPSLLLSYRTDP